MKELRCDKDKIIARQFGREYFDGQEEWDQVDTHTTRSFKQVVEDMIQYYSLTNESSILDIGCAKGFMLHDFKEALPDCKVAGIDISDYCLENSMPSVKKFCKKASCENLPYSDNSFDLVISIATIHNLDIKCKESLKNQTFQSIFY